MTGGLSRHLPWWTRPGAKLLLARLPLPYHAWRKVGVFRHGAMLDKDYAPHVFEYHFRHVRPTWTAGRTVLELGPDDSLATALLAAERGRAS